MNTYRNPIAVLWSFLWLGMLAGCNSTPESYVPAYQAALARTDPAETGTVVRQSAEGQAAIARFKDLFSVLSTENVRNKAREVYAENAYFNDTLKTVIGAEAIEAYLLESAGRAASITVHFDDTVGEQGEYYLRWTMSIQFEEGSEPVHSIGMTHIRFDENGKVVLHQDYWDAASGLFEHLPVIGGLIRFVKGRL